MENTEYKHKLQMKILKYTFILTFLLVTIFILTPPRYTATFLYKINNYEQKALNGDKNALLHAFIYYVHTLDDSKKAESFFRKAAKNSQQAKILLGQLLYLIPPKTRKKDLEALTYFYDVAIKNPAKKDIFYKYFNTNEYNITIDEIKNAK